MIDLKTVVGEARLPFYRRVLPVASTAVALVFIALFIWSYANHQTGRGNGFLGVAIFLSILAALAWDVSRMIDRICARL